MDVLCIGTYWKLLKPRNNVHSCSDILLINSLHAYIHTNETFTFIQIGCVYVAYWMFFKAKEAVTNVCSLTQMACGYEV
jgi:hypothetical protein